MKNKKKITSLGKLKKVINQSTPINIIKGKNIDKLIFKKLSMDALEEMHAYSTDKRMYEFLAFNVFKNKNDTKKYIQKLINRMNSNDDNNLAIYWEIRRNSDKRLIGTSGLLNLSYSNQSTEWGFGVDPNLWGKGYILQILESMKHYVFNTLFLNRLYGTTFLKNMRTIETMRAVGMSEEGVLREFASKNGKFHDGWKYSLLKREYKSFHKSTILNKNSLLSDKKVKKIIKAISSILNNQKINENSSMENVSKWDSLNHMAIMIKINEITGKRLGPSEISEATSVKKIISLISK